MAALSWSVNSASSLRLSASWHSTLSLIAHNWVGGTGGRHRLCVQRASGQVNGALVWNRERSLNLSHFLSLSFPQDSGVGKNRLLSNLKRGVGVLLTSPLPLRVSSPAPVSQSHELERLVIAVGGNTNKTLWFTYLRGKSKGNFYLLIIQSKNATDGFKRYLEISSAKKLSDGLIGFNLSFEFDLCIKTKIDYLK